MNWIVIAVISMVCSAFFSGTEIAYVTSDRVRAELDVKKGGLPSKILNVFYGHSDFFITTILVGNNIMLVVYGMGAAALLGVWLRPYIPNEALFLIVSTIISTGVILIVGEFFPKLVFRINPNSSIRYLALPLFPVYIVLYPFTLLVTWLSRMLMLVCGIKGRKTRNSLISVGDLNQYIERNIKENNKEQKIENEVKIFHNALDFYSNHLKDCMIPRNEIKGVDIDGTTVDDLEKLFLTTGHSKAIVYKGDIDNIVGYIHVSELFTASDKNWKDRVKPVLFAPETLLSNKMMRCLLSEKKSVAIVVDEFGGTAGMVTLEDIVEEIFGDIQDEHDESGLIARKIDENKWEFSARMEIEQLNDTYGMEFPESDDYQTLAGYVLYNTGTIPDKNDIIDLPPYRIEVLDKTANKLELLSVTVMRGDGEDGKANHSEIENGKE